MQHTEDDMAKEDHYTNTVEDAAKFAADHYVPDDDSDDDCDAGGDATDDDDGPCCNSDDCPCGGYRMGNIRRRRW
jgi:hypothetical protein